MKTIGIYPGNFQPPTRAHYQVYKRLKQLAGPDTFVITTDKTPTPEAPLNFGDKEQIWVRDGVPASHIVKVQNWKHPIEIFNNFSPTHTKVIFALNHKEAEELSKKKGRLGQVKGMEKMPDHTPSIIKEDLSSEEPQLNPEMDPDSEESQEDPESAFRDIEKHKNPKDLPDQNKEVWMTHDGKMSYFQPYKGNENSMSPLSERGYILIIDDTRIEGKPISTPNIRQVLGSPRYKDDEKKKFFRFVFGWFDVGLYTLMTAKFRLAHQVSSPDEETTSMPSMRSMVRGPATPQSPVATPQAPLRGAVREKIQELVRDILGEIMDEDYSSTMNASASNTSDMASSLDQEKSAAEQRKDSQKQKINLVQQKKEAEAEAKKNKQQRDQYATTVKSYDSFQKKNDRQNIDNINKQIAKPISPTSPIK